ncbi:acyl-CoA dehydrogenase family protein [Amycolatopsis acidiphila]|uniref:Acyl-[acyl-carrier-protein] dehydrogenase MbtN n=1 Tax=Amycolatopsis acidiphila TaxID=715473 RepID=A0A558AHU2_9PSEU|nr:acyl-CoA dehydrogenase family protein [Amycolatopsis acidiphila]TVT23846.1 acyl-CoA dehydrogenase [Amycolatopsis acidiphila]UIJ61178.1 acyl-CoA dehydrogenase family protein [Amycolatopsis acidiphila]GHG86284.1 acyl-CoA dehydrogenase [Amycolatopsis acidiphila]
MPEQIRTVYDEDHELFRQTVQSFIKTEVAPHDEDWEQRGIVDRSLFSKAGDAGLLLFATPETHGGAGIGDWRFSAILDEEFGRSGYASAGLALALQNDVVGPYILDLTNEEQKARWLPGMTSGELVGAIAMTEPGTGSDLSGIATRAVREGDDYVLNGSKTFISNGQNADLVVVAARTSEDKHRGLSLVVVERGMAGFERGRNLDKLGLHGQDTSELHFTDVRVPVANRLGEEGEGFFQLMRNLPQERLSLAVTAVSAAEGVLARTLEYVSERRAFGNPIGRFQHSRFLLAELRTEVDIARVFVDHCVHLHSEGRLSPVQAAKAKWWCTELQVRVADRCLQLHGGYGYMREYPVSRAFVDARIQTIYGGTTEIMKEIIGRDLGL